MQTKVYTIYNYPRHAEIEPTKEMIAEVHRLKKHRATCLKNKLKRKKRK